MEDLSGSLGFAEYTTFILENEIMKYRLSAEGFSGNVGKVEFNVVKKIIYSFILKRVSYGIKY